MANPNQEICPDYALPEFEDAYLLFIVDGKTNKEATTLLKNLWNLKNAKEIVNWECQCAANAQEVRQVVELAEQEAKQQQVLQQAKKAKAKKEEQKKHKNKYMLISDGPLPDTTLILLPQHTLNKLYKGEYIPLYLFTNKDIQKVEEEESGDEDLLTLVQMDKGLTFQTSEGFLEGRKSVCDGY